MAFGLPRCAEPEPAANAQQLQGRLLQALEDGLREAAMHSNGGFTIAKAEAALPYSTHVGFYSNAQVIGNLLHLVVQLALFWKGPSAEAIVQCGPPGVTGLADQETQTQEDRDDPSETPQEVGVQCVAEKAMSWTQTGDLSMVATERAMQTDGAWVEYATKGVRVGGGYHVFRAVEPLAPSWSEFVTKRDDSEEQLLADGGRHSGTSAVGRGRELRSRGPLDHQFQEVAAGTGTMGSPGHLCGAPLRAAVAARLATGSPMQSGAAAAAAAVAGAAQKRGASPTRAHSGVPTEQADITAWVDQLLAEGEESGRRYGASEDLRGADRELPKATFPNERSGGAHASPVKDELYETVIAGQWDDAQLFNSLRGELSKQGASELRARPLKPLQQSQFNRGRPGSAPTRRRR